MLLTLATQAFVAEWAQSADIRQDAVLSEMVDRPLSSHRTRDEQIKLP
jgi:hypothetical protein